jgi:hypothetical protein
MYWNGTETYEVCLQVQDILVCAKSSAIYFVCCLIILETGYIQNMLLFFGENANLGESIFSYCEFYERDVKLFLLLTQLAEHISLKNFLYCYISHTQIIFVFFGFWCSFQIWFQVPHTKFNWKGIMSTYWSCVLIHWLKSTAIRFEGVTSLCSSNDWG